MSKSMYWVFNPRPNCGAKKVTDLSWAKAKLHVSLLGLTVPKGQQAICGNWVFVPVLTDKGKRVATLIGLPCPKGWDSIETYTPQ